MPTYPYQKLEASTFEIRLLTLQPGNFADDLICQLCHTALESAPQYEALSYTWGAAELTSELILDGVRCGITENLEVALRYIRDANKARTLWVDAVCINQADLDERAQQVQRMRDIFRLSRRVLAWTGPAVGQHGDDAMAIVADLGQILLRLFEGVDEISLPGPDVLLANGFDIASRNWPVLWELLKRPYWGRVWVIQELATGFNMAPLPGSDIDADRCLVGCGHRWVPSLLLMAVIVFLNLHNEDGFSQFITARDDDGGIVYAELAVSLVASGALGALVMVDVLRVSGLEPGGRPPSLCKLLGKSAEFQATDRKDKIFALLGLAAEHGAFMPDYGLSADVTAMRLVAFHVETPDDTAACTQLEILCGNRCRLRGTKGGPGWIPEFSGGGILEGPVWQPERALFSSGGPRCLTQPVVDYASGLLSIEGVEIGVIETVIGPGPQPFLGPYADDHDDDDATDPLPDYKTLESKLYKYAAALAPAQHEDFLRALLGDQNIAKQNHTVRPAPAALVAKGRVWAWGSLSDDEIVSESVDKQRTMGYAISFLTEAFANLAWRCFFTTSLGGQGLGPHGTTKGDVVIVCPGSDYCFLVRRAGPHYKLVGDAYVQGVMDGEVLRAIRDGMVETRLFTLC